MFADLMNGRMTISFFTVLLLHALLLFMMYSNHAQLVRKGRIITNVEFLEIEKPAAPVIREPGPKPAAFKAPSLPFFPKAEEAKTAAEKPRELSEETLKKASARAPLGGAEKLEEKAAPLRKLSTVQLDELKRQRDTKINELVDMSGGKSARAQKLLAQEQVLTENTRPVARPSAGGGPGIEAVGMKRALSGGLADIEEAGGGQRKASAADAVKAAQAAESDASPLIEKKRLLKMQLAALNNPQQPATASMAGGGQQLADVTGTLKERQKAKEVVELQKIIEAQSTEPAAPKDRNLDRLVASARSGGETKTGPPGMPEKRTRTLDGAVAEVKKPPVEISGPLKQRKVISSKPPKYPDWAKKKGIEADVMLKFYVNPAGAVTQDITVVRTSGYPELDALSVEALKKWVFAPLAESEPRQDQWGVVTIRYVLE